MFPDIAAEDGLDARLARGAIELDHAKYVGEIGQTQRRHGIRRGLFHRLVHPHDAVDDGELAVQAQVNEARICHGAILLPRAQFRPIACRPARVFSSVAFEPAGVLLIVPYWTTVQYGLNAPLSLREGASGRGKPRRRKRWRWWSIHCAATAIVYR